MLVYINTSEYIDGNFYLFGTDVNGKPVNICVYNHETYLLCKSQSTTSQITASEKRHEIKAIKALLGDSEIKITDITGEYMTESQFYKSESYYHYKVGLCNFNDLTKAKKILSDGSYSIPELPTTRNKFFSDLFMIPSQWVEIDTPSEKGQKTEEGVIWDDFMESDSSKNPIQILLKSSSLKKSDTKLNPPEMDVITFDCEMMSGRFGIEGSRAHPSPTREDDIIYALSLVRSNSRTKEITDKFCLFVSKERFEVPNGEIIFCDDEEELLNKFSQMIRTIDPDLINCYNGQGFDFPYIQERSSTYSIEAYGRLKPFVYNKFDLNIKFAGTVDQIYKSKSWEGAGGTWHKYTTPLAYGRVIVDSFNLVKGTKINKGVAGKLQSLKLNDVGKYFVGETKEDISYEETYLGYRSQEPGILSRIASYCIQDSILTWKVFDKNNGVVYLREASRMFMLDMNDILSVGQSAKINDNFLIKGIERKFVFYSYDIPKKFKVKGGHVEKPLVGKRTNVICFDFASMYPSAQMAKNICLSTFCSLKPSNLDPSKYDEYCIEVEVADIEAPGYYYDFVQDFDVQLINDDNFIKEFFIQNDLELRYKTPFLNLVRAENDIEKEVSTEILKVYFIKNDVYEGILPKMLSELKQDRSVYKRMMKNSKETNDNVSYEIYNKRQELVKVAMNSIYGLLGSTRSPMTCLEASSTITYVGRESIKKVRDFLLDKGCRIIYGDTDSVMFQIPGYSEEGRSFKDSVDPSVVEFGKNILDEINNFLPKPMEVEFEKVMHVVPIKKKHYLGVKIYEDGKNVRDVFVKGLAGIRGDSTPFARNLFEQVVEKITTNESKENIQEYVSKELKKLEEGEIPNDMLAVSAMLGNGYKSESAPMNVYSKYLKSIGELAEAGTKIPYIVTVGEKNKPKSYFYRPPDTKEPVDYKHYYERAFKPINEIIQATFNE